MGKPLNFGAVERPWLNNKSNISCIPDGIYRVEEQRVGRYYNAYKRRWRHACVYVIVGVDGGRYGILFHAASSQRGVKGCLAICANINIKGKGKIAHTNGTSQLAYRNRFYPFMRKNNIKWINIRSIPSIRCQDKPKGKG